jgi:tRNA(Ile)-lysidine synthase
MIRTEAASKKGGRRSPGKGAVRDNDTVPVSAAEAKQLFADFKPVPAIVLAVSGGPDSVAMMVLAARWRGSLRQGPKLIAVTVDHGLRREAVAEARVVKALARSMGIEHHTLRWRGAKPKTGLPSAARDARYKLLAQLARRYGTVHVLTAHTRDDQAETVLMRISRGSGLAGLAAMARRSERYGVTLARPFLDLPKSRLVATLDKAGIAFATDPTNHDTAFTRPRLRALMPALAEEGCDARNLVRLATRLARANAALEVVANAAERALVEFDPVSLRSQVNAEMFFTAPEEIRLRVLTRAVDRAGHEGTAELGKTEALLAALEAVRHTKAPVRFQQTLAGAIVSFGRNLISVGPAPPRRAAKSGNKP